MPWTADGSRKKSPLYKKSGFKMGSAQRHDASSNARTPGKQLGFMNRGDMSNINIAPMSDGNLAEANMDGSINVDPSVDLSSPFGKKLLKHEQQHIDDIEDGIASYDDNHITFKGEKYKRINVNGEWGVMWKDEFKPEGDSSLPWEQRAINAEKKK
tara:strand:+ start:157 stop:624 length:468 start_codon:yes stop_codon:yes gene_type:complete